MIILDDSEVKFEEVNEPMGVAIGKFDGIHIGHREILSNLDNLCKKNGLKSGVFTFKKHPGHIIPGKDKPSLLTTNKQRMGLFRELGMEYLILNDLDTNFQRLSPEQFVDYLQKKYNVKLIVVGHNFRFGHKGAGDSSILIEIGKRKGITVEIVQPQIYDETSDNTAISSTVIRKLLSEGNLELAKILLGRNYCIEVIASKYDKSNRTLKVEFDQILQVPKLGIYIGHLLSKNTKTPIIINISKKNERSAIECFGKFEGDLSTYSEIEFVDKVNADLDAEEINKIIGEKLLSI